MLTDRTVLSSSNSSSGNTQELLRGRAGKASEQESELFDYFDRALMLLLEHQASCSLEVYSRGQTVVELLERLIDLPGVPFADAFFFFFLSIRAKRVSE
mgnify:CR=1 FL=1